MAAGWWPLFLYARNWTHWTVLYTFITYIFSNDYILCNTTHNDLPTKATLKYTIQNICELDEMNEAATKSNGIEINGAFYIKPAVVNRIIHPHTCGHSRTRVLFTHWFFLFVRERCQRWQMCCTKVQNFKRKRKQQPSKNRKRKMGQREFGETNLSVPGHYRSMDGACICFLCCVYLCPHWVNECSNIPFV